MDTKKNTIDGVGSRIFPMGVVEKDLGTKKEQSKNATRRDARQIRRQYFRKKLRKSQLLHLLITHDMCPLKKAELKKWTAWDKSIKSEGRKFPSTPEFIEWLKMHPYELRTKALKENISLEEFGRIMYHLIQRRGFLSGRKNKEEGKIFDGKDNMVGIDSTKELIQDRTLGSALHTILPEEGKPYKETDDTKRARSRYTLRDMYVNEFHEIWKKQAEQLGLKDKIVEQKKVRTLKGGLNNNRNKKKIELLNKKYGKENVKIETKENKHKVTTTTQVPFNEFLAGGIKDEDGKLTFKSNDSVLFYQRPLRSQKGLLGKCSLEGRKFYDKKEKKWRTVGPTPCPNSHPDFEMKRTYEFINNIKYGANQRLDETQRQIVLDLINANDGSFLFKKVKEKLNLTDEKFEYDDKYPVVGNYTIKNLKPLFTDEAWNSNKYEIWHYFYFYDDAEALLDKLKKKYGKNGLIEKGIEDKILGKEKDGRRKGGIKLKEGYSNISLKATRNILPYLNKKDYWDNYYKNSEAVILGGVRNTFGKRWDYFKNSWTEIEKEVIKINRQKDNKEGEAIEKIKAYLINNDYGFEENDRAFQKLYHHSQETEKKELQKKLPPVENLRNPIVQQGLHEMRRLVNDLIKEHKKFDRINVELGRDLKNGKKKRVELTDVIKRNRENNYKARAKLTEFGLRHSRENIQKYLLYKEIENRAGKGTCPYTGQTINISDVLGSDGKIQIEHIIPKSISLDDSFANKTLCDAKFNGEKGELTPYKFYQINSDKKLWGVNSWDDVKNRAFKLLPYRKAKRFTAETDFKPDGFIERQKNDMRYMSKKAKELLSNICEDVRAMPGSLTAELRHLWGVNNVLQPIPNVEIPDIEIEKDKVYPYYMVVNEKNEQVALQRIYNPKPDVKAKQTTLAGVINKKGEFSTTEKYMNYKEQVGDEKEEGDYWKLLNLSEPKEMVQVFTDKPQVGEDKIVLRGKIEKGKFKHDRINAVFANDFEDGSYWAVISIKNKKLIKPEKGKEPKKKGKQMLLYGEAKDGVFISYIYQCSTDVADGKYWLLLDLKYEKVAFEKALNPKPKAGNKQITIQGAVNDTGAFSSEIDYQHQFQTDKEAGKYWAVFDIIGNGQQYEPIKNKKPKLSENQKLIEGNIWVDKYTGEIKFDPKKNREDQRHHAIDAIVIALSEQSYFQKLSAYYASRKKKGRGNEFDKEQLNFPDPWENFHADVKKAANDILVSYRQDSKVLTETKKGTQVRGALHEQNLYGKTKDCEKGEYVKRYAVSGLSVLQIRNIVDKKVKQVIVDGVSTLTAIKKDKSRKETPIKLDEKEKAIFNQLIKGEKLSKEDKKQEKKVKEKVSDLLKLLNFYMPNEGKRYQRLKKEDAGFTREPVPIKKVRVKKAMGNAKFLKEAQGLHLKTNEGNDYNQYVEPGSNHHVAIYKTQEDELTEKVVTFWEAVERKRTGMDIIDKKLKDGTEFIEVLERDDMFLFKGLMERDIEKGIIDEVDIDKADNNILSKYLYRVEAISSKYYEFRQHLESTHNREYEPYYFIISSLGKGKKGWLTFNPIKVRITRTGKIEKL